VSFSSLCDSLAKFIRLDVDTGDTNFSWRRAHSSSDRLPRPEGNDVLALSAFHLSSIPNGTSRKELVKEMWESGARTLVCCVQGQKQLSDNQAYLGYNRPR
jgi:hypothetical protein